MLGVQLKTLEKLKISFSNVLLENIVGLQEINYYLWCTIFGSSMTMGDEHWIGLGRGSNLLHGVRYWVTRNYFHAIFCSGSRDILLECEEVVSRAVHYILDASLQYPHQPMSQVLGLNFSFAFFLSQVSSLLQLFAGRRPHSSSCFTKQKTYINTKQKTEHVDDK